MKRFLKPANDFVFKKNLRRRKRTGHPDLEPVDSEQKKRGERDRGFRVPLRRAAQVQEGDRRFGERRRKVGLFPETRRRVRGGAGGVPHRGGFSRGPSRSLKRRAGTPRSQSFTKSAGGFSKNGRTSKKKGWKRAGKRLGRRPSSRCARTGSTLESWQARCGWTRTRREGSLLRCD